MDYAQYKRRTVVASMGTSPAVLTETLHSLVADRPRDAMFVPTEIVVVTTAVGKRRLEQKLLNPSGSLAPYDALSAQLIQLDRLNAPLPRPRIVVPVRGEGDDRAGEEIEDAHAQADLDALADLLLTEVQNVTSDPSSIMVLSLSGGKKGMSHIAGQVMSLCGRPHDQLVHIAPTPAGLERCENFYFPSADRYGEEQYTWRKDDGTEDGCSVSEVSLELAQQSYLPLRSLVQKAFSADQFAELEFTQIVKHLRQQLAPTAPVTLTMTLSPRRRAVVVSRPGVGDQGRSNSVQLSPQLFSYLWCLSEAQKDDAGIDRPITVQGACEILKKQELLEDGGWDPQQRAARAQPWFGVEGPVKASDRKLAAFDPRIIEEEFLCKPTDVLPKRKKLQNELAAKCNTAIAELLKPWMDINQVDFLVPVGRKGPGRGVSKHRLPDTWQIEILEE